MHIIYLQRHRSGPETGGGGVLSEPDSRVGGEVLGKDGNRDA